MNTKNSDVVERKAVLQLLKNVGISAWDNIESVHVSDAQDIEHLQTMGLVEPTGKALAHVKVPQNKFPKVGNAIFNPLHPILEDYFKQQSAGKHRFPYFKLGAHLNTAHYESKYSWVNGTLYRTNSKRRRIEVSKDEQNELIKSKNISELVLIHYPFVRQRVFHAMKRRRFVESGALDPDDLLQAGMMGLLTAIEKFDPEYPDANFLSLARISIDNEIIGLINTDGGVLRMPVNLQTDVKRVLLARQSAAHPSAEAVEPTGTSIEVDRRDRKLFMPDETFTVPVEVIDEEARADRVGMLGNPLHANFNSAPLRNKLMRDTLESIILNSLSSKEMRAVMLHFGIGSPTESEMTLEKIAEKMPNGEGTPVSKERIRQLEDSAFRKLRRALVVAFGSINKQGDREINFNELMRMFTRD